MSILKEYVRHLGALEGNTFEAEVCLCLQKRFLDFQRIPDRPHGDGGLDGLSHRQTSAYCCYGPEQESFKKKTKGLKDDILRKFKKDMCRIFELRQDGSKLKHWRNTQLETILSKDKKIHNLYLVVSVFNDHRIIGPLNEYFELCRSKSINKFVDEEASISIWGPEDVASGAVDDLALRRIEQRSLMTELRKEVKEGQAAEPKSENFDEKFAWLQRELPEKADQISSLRDEFRKSWTIALGINQKLVNTSSSVHESLEGLREDVTIDAQLKSMEASDAFKLLSVMRELLKDRISERFQDSLSSDIIDPLASGETARLIGECPIDWRQ